MIKAACYVEDNMFCILFPRRTLNNNSSKQCSRELLGFVDVSKAYELENNILKLENMGREAQFSTMPLEIRLFVLFTNSIKRS